MTPGLRKFVLTAHVISSFGWLGAVVAFLPLAVTGVTSQDAHTVGAVYLVMEVIGWCALVPLSFASLLTGLVMSLGTRWGLFRHYWVVIKLLITIVATIVLVVHMQSISSLAGVGAVTPLSSTDHRGLRLQLVVNASTALLVLFVATMLSVYKPRSMTAYGRRKQHEQRAGSQTAYRSSPSRPS